MDVTPAFFDALEHLEKIHADCNALLITEHQRAGYVGIEGRAEFFVAYSGTLRRLIILISAP